MTPTKKITEEAITQVIGLKKAGPGTKEFSELLTVAKSKVKKYSARVWAGGDLENPSKIPRIERPR